MFKNVNFWSKNTIKLGLVLVAVKLPLIPKNSSGLNRKNSFEIATAWVNLFDPDEINDFISTLLPLSCSSLPLPPSHILIIVGRPQQRFHLNRLVVFEVRPEEIQPVAVLRLKSAEEVALVEINDVLAPSSVERTFSALRDEMSISEMATVNK